LGAFSSRKNPRATACLDRNITAVCKSLALDRDGVTVLTMDAAKAPLDLGGVPDLVFIDPPYELIAKVAPALFLRLTAALQGNPDPVIVFEMPGGTEADPPDWTCVKRLGKGTHQADRMLLQSKPRADLTSVSAATTAVAVRNTRGPSPAITNRRPATPARSPADQPRSGQSPA